MAMAVLADRHSAKTMKERPQLAQRFLAAILESIHFAKKIRPEQSIAQQDTQTFRLGNAAIGLRNLCRLPGKSFDGRTRQRSHGSDRSRPRDPGTNVRKKPADLFDNGYVDQLSKSGFLKELWGSELR